jgi:hypothetical protein
MRPQKANEETPMTAPSVREALEFAANLEPSADKTKLLLQISALKTMATQALATPPAPTPIAARERIDRAVRSACCTTFSRGYSPETVADAVDAILALLPDAAAIRADERERCAKIAETCSVKRDWDTEIAAAIRAAGEK